MNKILRYSLVSLLTLFFGTAMAQTTFNFNEDYKSLFPTLPGVSSSDSHDGDFNEPTTCTLDGISVTVSPLSSGTNANRIWTSTPRLRMYSGTLTIAAEGKTITSIEFNCGKWNAGNTADKGELATEGNSATWTGSANSIVVTIAGNTQMNSLTVYVDGEGPIDITNTPETAYTVAEANNLISEGVGLDAKVYVKGTVTDIKEISTQFGNATYYINDTESTEGQLMVYRGYYLGGEKFTTGDELKVGDKVVVYGQLVNYNGTYEINTGNQLYSVNGITTGIDNAVTTPAADADAPVYNLAGQRVSKDTKGILIQNGKKFINK